MRNHNKAKDSFSQTANDATFKFMVIMYSKKTNTNTGPSVSLKA
jgi:hypothetical protein